MIAEIIWSNMKRDRINDQQALEAAIAVEHLNLLLHYS